MNILHLFHDKVYSARKGFATKCASMLICHLLGELLNAVDGYCFVSVYSMHLFTQYVTWTFLMQLID